MNKEKGTFLPELSEQTTKRLHKEPASSVRMKDFSERSGEQKQALKAGEEDLLLRTVVLRYRSGRRISVLRFFNERPSKTRVC